MTDQALANWIQHLSWPGAVVIVGAMFAFVWLVKH